MSSDKSAELCRILKTGKPNNTIFSLPDDLAKLSEAELLEFLNKNEKEIIDGVIDTFSKCGIKITANDNKVIIVSPGYYTTTFSVETMKMTKTHPIGFGSSSKRFTGGKKFTGINITKKNRKSLKYLKKNIRGMVMNGGEKFEDPISGLIKLICYSVIGVAAVGAAGIVIGLSPIVLTTWACKKIYERFNRNPTTVVATNTDYDTDNETVASEESDNGDGNGQEPNNTPTAPTDEHEANMEAEKERILDEMREERQKKLSSMSAEEEAKKEEKIQERLRELINKRKELMTKKTSPFDAFHDGTPGGKKSRSKTHKQKRRKTKK
jgi:hypothetical protein